MLDRISSFNLSSHSAKWTDLVNTLSSVFPSCSFVCIKEIRKKNRIMELTSIQEAPVLSKQMGMNTVSWEPFLAHIAWWVRVGAPAVRAAVCHEAVHLTKWKIFPGIDEPYSSSSQNSEAPYQSRHLSRAPFPWLKQTNVKGSELPRHFSPAICTVNTLPFDKKYSLCVRYAISIWDA